MEDREEQGGPGGMPEKLVPQPRSIGRSFDESGDVGDHETAVDSYPRHSEVRMQSGKRVVGDLGARGGNGANESGFSGIGQTEQSDVGKHFQLELERAMLAGLAGSRLSRRAVAARFQLVFSLPP